MLCLKCEGEFKINVVIDGKMRNMSRRKFCLKCSPFGSKNTRDLRKHRYPRGAYHHVKAWRRRRKQKMVACFGGKCAVCAYDRCVEALVFHHLNPAEKERDISDSFNKKVRWELVVEELKKCILVCNRCHSEIHAGLVEVPTAYQKFDEKLVATVGAAPTTSPLSRVRSTAELRGQD